MWTDNVVGSISKALRIRIGIKSLYKSNDQFLLFSDEKNEDSRGITYIFNCFGNWDTNGPGYRPTGAEKLDSPIVDEEYRYIHDTVPLNEKKWFDFEWSIEGDEMSVSMLDDVKGSGKKKMHSWPRKDFKLNYLMFASGWWNYAQVTVYIIDGLPSEDEIEDYFKNC